MPFSQFLPYCCDKTCLLLTPFCERGELFRSLTFLAQSLENKGNPKDLEQMPRTGMFCEGRTAAAAGQGEVRGAASSRNPLLREAGSALAAPGQPWLTSGRNAPGPGGRGVHRRKGWQEGPGAPARAGAAEGRRPCRGRARGPGRRI